jgi:hypothetical protein
MDRGTSGTIFRNTELKAGRVKRIKEVAGRQKAGASLLHTTTAWWFGAERPPLSQIAKVFGGRAFVSVHLCPVSTPSLRSVGHSPQVHGTQAQIYLATSPCLNVVRHSQVVF